MTESRISNSISNIYSGLIYKIISLFINFASRTVFIRILGDGCLGLNGLFTSMLSIFSLAELGIGQAITFYMYRPIANKDIKKLSSLIHFYKLCYRIIGMVILVIGLCLIPFLPKFINLDLDIGYNINIIYVLYLINTVITYLFFSYPQTVLNANQKQYIINKNESIFVIISAITEIITLIISRNYIIYIIIKINIIIIKNILLAIKTIKMYPYIIDKDYNKLNKYEVISMFKDVYSIFIVKLSSQLLNSTDNLFISSMFGTVLTGYNSNYLMIINAVYGVLSTIIYSLGGSIGNLYVTETKTKTEEVFSVLDFINCWISCFCTVCLFQLLNPFISLFWGEKYIFSTLSVALMSASFYMVSSLYVLFNFRQSMGLFRYCIYNQLIAAIINIILDIVFGKLIGINGLFLATVIANLCIAIFPYAKNIYQIGFEQPYKKYIFHIIRGYLLCIISCVIVKLICEVIPISYLGFIVMGIICCIVPNILQVIFLYNSYEFKGALLYVKKIMNFNKL